MLHIHVFTRVSLCSCWGKKSQSPTGVSHCAAVCFSLCLHQLSEGRSVDTVHVWFWLLFNFSLKCFVTDCTVYQRSVVSEVTCCRVSCSFFTVGGFKVEVMVDVAHVKSSLNVWLCDTFEEEKMMLDCRMRVDLLQGEIHSFLVRFRKCTVSLLCSRGKEQSSNAQQQQCQSSHPFLFL